VEGVGAGAHAAVVDECESGSGEGGLHFGYRADPEPVGGDRLAGHGHGIAEAENQPSGRGQYPGQADSAQRAVDQDRLPLPRCRHRPVGGDGRDYQRRAGKCQGAVG